MGTGSDVELIKSGTLMNRVYVVIPALCSSFVASNERSEREEGVGNTTTYLIYGHVLICGISIDKVLMQCLGIIGIMEWFVRENRCSHGRSGAWLRI